MPLIVRWPGVIKRRHASATSRSSAPTSTRRSSKWPARRPAPTSTVDGVSLVPAAARRAERRRRARRASTGTTPHYSNQGGTPGGAIRQGDFKLIEFYEDGHVELYNLKDDLGEQTDLAAELPDKANELRNQLQDWRARRRCADAHAEPRLPSAKAEGGATAVTAAGPITVEGVLGPLSWKRGRHDSA